jgi:hypothetical protein
MSEMLLLIPLPNTKKVNILVIKGAQTDYQSNFCYLKVFVRKEDLSLYPKSISNRLRIPHTQNILSFHYR